jgi:hypothetical protein
LLYFTRGKLLHFDLSFKPQIPSPKSQGYTLEFGTWNLGLGIYYICGEVLLIKPKKDEYYT